jgi:anti-sigma regulatory factor (Ser/Thr protein kinase)
MLKKTTITWGSAADQTHEVLAVARQAKLVEMVQAQKVHIKEAEQINDVTTVRFWKDQAAASEFVTFIYVEAAKHGCVVISAIIEDYVE